MVSKALTLYYLPGMLSSHYHNHNLFNRKPFQPRLLSLCNLNALGYDHSMISWMLFLSAWVVPDSRYI